MKLLMITRKVDAKDPMAGFVYDWAKKLGEKLENLYVITWQVSQRGDLPANIAIYSLPENKLAKIFTLQKKLSQILPKVDGVFCHMNPEYTILAAPLAKLRGKKIISWYTHGAVTWRLRLLEKLATIILTASTESFRLSSKKVKVVGHGIDLEKFKFNDRRERQTIENLISVGRISPTKDYESMIKAIDFLVKEGISNLHLKIIGGPGLPEHKGYFDSLKQMVVALKLEDKIEFLGPQSPQEIPQRLARTNLFINLSGTGSLDKAVLEAMAVGCLVLTSNEAFRSILPPLLMVEQNQPRQLAEKIKWLRQLPWPEWEKLRIQLRAIIEKNHNLDQLIQKIIDQFI